MLALALPVSALTFVQDGNGYWWDFDIDGAVADGSPTPVEATDAFDWAMRLRIDGVLFPESANQSLDGRVVTTGPETVGALVVTRRAYVTDTAGQGWACFLEYLENPTASDISVTARIGGNLGSDGDTTVTASSSGDAVFGIDDRWVASDDNNDGAGDPSLCFNFWGAGGAVTPSAVNLPASQEDYYADFPVNVPAESTVLLMHFAAQNVNDAAAAANAGFLDGLPAEALAFLNAASGTVVNWDIPPDDLDVSPSGVFTAAGKHGGAFTPASNDYTLTNNGAATINWSATASVAWLAVAAGGTVDPGTPEDVTVSINANANALAPGVHSGTVSFTNDGSGATFVRTVQLTVTDRLVVRARDFAVVGAEKLVVRGGPGGPFTPIGASYVLTNVDDQVTNWSITTPAWLKATSSPPIGTPLNPGDAITVFIVVEEASAVPMPPGDFPDVVAFNNDTVGGGNAVAVDVELRLRESVYVDADAAPAGDGSSWAAAFNAIQDGINAAAVTTPPSWVFVADGTYAETLTMLEDVEVFGGFVGGEVSLTERDIADNPPVIIDGGDAATTVSFGALEDAGLDGVRITGGAAADGGGVVFDGSGSGCYVALSYIVENTATRHGGGVYAFNDATPVLLGCVILGNTLSADDRQFGGGVACEKADPRLYQCYIGANSGRFGGGIGCIKSSPVIENCTIVGNAATIATGGAGAGAIFAHDKSSPAITNCRITGNYAHDWNAGTLYCQGLSAPVLTNCTIANNSSNDGRSGGIVVNSGSMPSLTNCILDNLSGVAVIEEGPRVGHENDESDVFVAHGLFSNSATADFRDWHDGVVTDYTGGDAINAQVDGAVGNVAGGPDPRFVEGVSGVWTAEPVYDNGTNRTTLTTAGSPFPVTGNGLVGRAINADTSQKREAVIMENTADTVVVMGDVTSASGEYGYVDAGDAFLVVDYHVDGDSPCINIGDNAVVNPPEWDIEMAARIHDDAMDVVDLGAYECTAPEGATLVAMAVDGEPVPVNGTVQFIITFSRPVASGLDVTDFTVFGTDGQDTAEVISLAAGDNGYTWIVTVGLGDDDGTIRLEFTDVGDPVTDGLGFVIQTSSSSSAAYLIDMPEKQPAAGWIALALLGAAMALTAARRARTAA